MESTDIARIEYKLARNATLSIYVLDGQGGQHYFRRERPRSRTLDGQPYRVDFGGVIPREVDGLRQDRVLPDGDYTLILEATDEKGRSAVHRVCLYYRRCGHGLSRVVWL